MKNKLCSTREILFRGKRIDNGEWIEGDYHRMKFEWSGDTVHHGIYPLDEHMGIEVDSSAICQYTGLIDKNGRKIFEGDIIKATDRDGEVKTGDISFEEGAWQVFGEIQERLYWLFDYIDYEFEVIGNIFDNPELVV